MTDTLTLAQAWLEHCREQAEYFDNEGEDDTAEKWHADAEAAEKAIKRTLDTTTYDMDELILAVTMDDVINASSEYGENIDPKITECLLNNQHKFEKAMEWGIMEHIWNIVHEVTDEVLTANNLTRPET